MLTHDHALRLRTHYLTVLKELAPSTALTFNFGYRVKPENASKPMKDFFNTGQREVYGRDWAKQLDRPWPVAFGFFENPDTNPHYHVLANVEPELSRWMEVHGPVTWKRLSSRGQLHFQEVYGPDGAWSYWTKRLASRQTFDEVWVYKDTRACTVGKSELRPRKQSGWL